LFDGLKCTLKSVNYTGYLSDHFSATHFANFWTRIWPRPLGGVGRRERKDSGSERPEHDVELAYKLKLMNICHFLK
jgi:hypothetical protein